MRHWRRLRRRGSIEASRAFGEQLLVRAAGLEPAQAFLPYGFSYQLRLSPPRRGAFVVWTIPSPWWAPLGAHFRRYPSSLYTFPSPGLARDCHLTGSPDFGQFYFPVSRKALKLCLSPLRLPVSPRPRDDLVIGRRFNEAKENLTEEERRQGLYAAMSCAAVSSLAGLTARSRAGFSAAKRSRVRSRAG